MSSMNGVFPVSFAPISVLLTVNTIFLIGPSLWKNDKFIYEISSIFPCKNSTNEKFNLTKDSSQQGR